MSLLLDIPSVLFVNIVTSFINVCDLIGFDSACTNHNQRQLLLDELHRLHSTDIFPFVNRHPPPLDYYIWLNARKIMTNLCFLSLNSFSGQKLRFRLDYEYLSTISVLTTKKIRSQVLKVINSCKSLTTLVCHGTEDILCGVDAQILQGLTSLNIDHDCAEMSVTMKRIATSCTNLKEFTSACMNSIELYASILQSNPMLQEVAVTCDMTLLDEIIHSHPNIVCLKLIMTEPFNLKSAAKKIKDMPECTLILRGGYSVWYTNKNSERLLTIDGYIGHDLADFLAAAKGLVGFQAVSEYDVEANVITDALVPTLIENSFRTLKCFMCNINNVSVASIRRILMECPRMRKLQLFNVTNDIVNAFTDLPNPKAIEVVQLDSPNLKMSTVMATLRNLSGLKHCDFSLCCDVDGETLNTLHECLMEYYYGKEDTISCELKYKRDKYVKTAFFDGLFLITRTNRGLFDLFM